MISIQTTMGLYKIYKHINTIDIFVFLYFFFLIFGIVYYNIFHLRMDTDKLYFPRVQHCTKFCKITKSFVRVYGIYNVSLFRHLNLTNNNNNN